MFPVSKIAPGILAPKTGAPEFFFLALVISWYPKQQYCWFQRRCSSGAVVRSLCSRILIPIYGASTSGWRMPKPLDFAKGGTSKISGAAAAVRSKAFSDNKTEWRSFKKKNKTEWCLTWLKFQLKLFLSNVSEYFYQNTCPTCMQQLPISIQG